MTLIRKLRDFFILCLLALVVMVIREEESDEC